MDQIALGERAGGPYTREELRTFVREVLGARLSRRALMPGHASPLDYLEHAFLGDTRRGRLPRPPGLYPRDCVVWANRGGGKTFLGAVATALDLIFKPGIEVRILAGSLEQAGRMHAHLRRLFSRPELAERVAGRITERRLRLRNGSGVELLAPSQTSVRGTRVQKLRCDEVELFTRRVWEAAQLTTRSALCGEWEVHGSVECLSTMHRPYGLMQELVRDCDESDPAKPASRRLFRWGVVDTLEVCGPGHHCRPVAEAPRGDALASLPVLPAARECPLLGECGGAAKVERREEGDDGGHVSVSDALRMKSRVPPAVWEAEMLCLRPSRGSAVLAEFDAAVHVVASLPWESGERMGLKWLCGMDFGYRDPTVVLWAALDSGGVLWIVDERVERLEPLEKHVAAILASPWPRPQWIGADPAARATNRQTGCSDAVVLELAGLKPRMPPLKIVPGILLVRARLQPADGSPARLFIHRRCEKLIEAMTRYHFPEEKPDSNTPDKDGPDHAVDALRYLVASIDAEQRTERGRYTG